MVAPVNAVFPVLSETATVSANTQYVFSFYAKKGTAGNVTCGIYDNTNGANIVNPVSYVSLLSDTTLVRISLAFTTPANCTSVSVFPVWYGTDYGSVTVYGMQLEVATISPSFPVLLTETGDTLIAESGTILTGELVEDLATPYQMTLGISPTVLGYTPLATSYSVVSKVKAIDVLKSSEIVLPVAKVRAVNTVRGYNRSTSTLVISKLKAMTVAKDTPSSKFNNTSSLVNKLLTPSNKTQMLTLTTSNVFYPTPFQNSPNAGDFKFGVIGQTPTSITTASSSLLQWYLEYGSQSDLLTTATSTTTNLTIKTFYFTKSAYTPFAVGSSIKVSNVNGSAYTATVIATDFSSVTIAMPTVEFPSIGTFVESSATVYSKLLVAPTNRGSGLARDRLYYNDMSPGIKGFLPERANIGQVSQSTSTGQLSKAFETFKGVSDSRRVGGVKAVSVLKSTPNNIRVSKLNTINTLRGTPYAVTVPQIVKIKRPVEGASFSIAPNITGFPTPFQNTPNAGDFKMFVVGQSPDATTTSTSSLLQWYLEYGANSDVLTISTATYTTSSVKTFYFGPTAYNPYSVGSIIKIGNIYGASYTATVVASSIGSVSIAMPRLALPSVGTYVETSATVYSQLLVKPVSRNNTGLARDNLYYFNMAPGIRVLNNASIATVSLSTNTGQLTKAVEVVKDVGTTIRASQLQKSIEVIRADRVLIKVDKVSAVAVIRSASSSTLSATLINKTKTQPTPIFTNDIRVATTRNVSVVRAEPSKLRTDKLNTTNVIRGVSSIIRASSIVKIKRPIEGAIFSIDPNITGFPTPFQNSPNPGDFKMFVTGQSPDATTTATSSMVQWYLEYGANSDVLSISTATYTTASVKTFYFAPTAYNPYSVGSSIKIGNVYGSSYTATVIASSVASVTIQMPTTALPSVGTYIESSATVYSQLLVAPTNRSSRLARDRFYYFNMSPGIKGVLAERSNVGIGNPTINNGNLQKAFEIVKDLTNNIRTGQLQKPIELVKGTLTRTDVAKLNAAAVVRDTRTTLTYSQLQKPIETVKETVGTLTTSTPIITKVKTSAGYLFSIANTYTNQVPKLTAAAVVRDTRTTLTYSQLQKAFESVKGVAYSTSTGVLRDVKIPVTSFVFSVANTYTNQVAKLTAVSVLKDAKVTIRVDKLTTANVVRGVSVSTSTPMITQVKIPVTRYVFSIANTYTNQVPKLTAVAVVEDARTTLAYSQLQKPIEAIRGISVSTSTPIITRFKTPAVSDVTFGTGTNLAPKLTATAVLRDATTTLRVSQLSKQLQSLREVRSISSVTNRLESTINTTTFIYEQSSVIARALPLNPRERLYYFYLVPDWRADHWQHLTNYNTVGVYNTPSQFGKVNAVNVLKGVVNNLRVDRVKAISVVRDAIPRRFEIATQSRKKLLEADRISFWYPAASTSTADISRLEIFDVGNYPGDFKLQIVGQSADYNNNLISWYLNDNDVLTPSAKSTSTIETLYYTSQFTQYPQLTPFPVGSRIKVTSTGSNNVLYYATVTSVTSNSISFVKPNIDIPISNTYIEGGSSVYPRSFVQPGTYPKNARENLYFFEMAPAIRDANKYQNTLVNRATAGVELLSTVTNRLESTINTSTFIYAQSLVKPSSPPRVQSPREALYYFYIAPGIKADVWQRLTNRNTIGPAQQSLSQGLLNPLKVGKDSIQDFRLAPSQGNLQKAFEIIKGTNEVPLINLVKTLKVNKDAVEIFYAENNGNLQKAFEIVKDVFNTFKLPHAYVIRLKTGDDKKGQSGVQDPTFRKKEPIQFWN